jgi:hypothetical protein
MADDKDFHTSDNSVLSRRLEIVGAVFPIHQLAQSAAQVTGYLRMDERFY